MWFRNIRNPVESLEFEFENFEALSNGSNLHSNASNPFQVVRICIRMPRMPFERIEIGFQNFKSLSNDSNFVVEGFESLSNCSNLHWNGSNPFEKV